MHRLSLNATGRPEEDPGPFYCRGTDGQLLYSGHRAQQPEIPQLVYPASSSVNGEVVGLFQICLQFVAKNIHLIETFYGIPEIIGQQIFDLWLKTDNYLTNSEERIWKIFMKLYDEYGSDFVSSLNLSRVGGPLHVLKMFDSLQHLDLSFSEFERSQNTLNTIGNMKHLKTLSLRKTKITDDSLRWLTASCRVMKRGLAKLETLDLSDNRRITMKSLKVLEAMVGLSRVNITNTCLDVAPHNDLSTSNRSGHCSVVELRSEDVVKKISNEGWGASAITNVLTRKESEDIELKQTANTQGPLNSDSIISLITNFYKKPKKNLTGSAGVDLTEESVVKFNRNSSDKVEQKTTNLSYKYLIINRGKQDEESRDTRETKFSTAAGPRCRKRKRDVQEHDSNDRATLSDDDLKLLAGYSSISSTQRNKKPKNVSSDFFG